MAIKVLVNSLTFSDNSTLSFEEDDIVVFVGPNNAGKSASLKEINNLLYSNKPEGKKVIKKIDYSTEGTLEKLDEFLEGISNKHFVDKHSVVYFQGIDYNIHRGNLVFLWRDAKTEGLKDLQSVFVNLLSTESRLTAANPPKNISLTTQAPTHPIHFLQRDDRIELKFSSSFRQAFGQDLIVHRNAGDIVPLHVGEKPLIQQNEDRVSKSYLERLEKLPLLHEQGDFLAP